MITKLQLCVAAEIDYAHKNILIGANYIMEQTKGGFIRVQSIATKKIYYIPLSNVSCMERNE
jgi:hypothetical protein